MHIIIIIIIQTMIKFLISFKNTKLKSINSLDPSVKTWIFLAGHCKNKRVLFFCSYVHVALYMGDYFRG